jgi:hypothetical protein
MCNAYNHAPGCTCGWGGDGHLGRSSGGHATDILGRFYWQHRDEDFCVPSACPGCGASVYFVRHNGGSVTFDELGRPWPKHGCFNDDLYGIQLRRLLSERPNASSLVFGVVIEVETTRPGEGGRIVVRCNDGTLFNHEIDMPANLSRILGRLLVVARDHQGNVSIRFVAPAEPRVIAYLQIIENGTRRLIEEFAYKRRPEAERRLSVLLSQHPGRYRIQIDKRTEL